MSPAETRRPRPSTWLPLMVCVAVTFPRFLLDSGDSIQRIALPGAAALTLWWCLPLLGFVSVGRSSVIRWGGSTVYLVAAASTLAAVYRSESSTAGFGVVFPPLYLALGLGVLLWLEVLALRRGGRNR